MTLPTLPEILELAREYHHKLPLRENRDAIPDSQALPGWIDHTLLKPEATPQQIERLCAEAIQYHFITVCVNSLYTPLAVEQCSGTGVGVCSVVGFPLGAVPTPVKCAETKGCLEQGAAEIDMVIPIGLMKAGLPGRVLEDIQAVAAVAHEGRARLKVILEMAYLTREEKILACLLSQAAGADYVKTSTGFGPSGATVEDVDLMRRVVGEQTGVKAAGGIRNLDQAVAMIRAGANRLGSSSGIVILAEAENLEKQVTVL